MQMQATDSASPGQSRTRAENDLIGLATPTWQVVMQLKAGLIAPSNDLRHKIDELLKQMEQRGEALRCNTQKIQSIKFALASFVDETVLTADFPLRDQWEKYPLQLEYFGEHLAGVRFFERLDQFLKSIESEADIVEVYYTCLLLGYKGKYKIYLEDQLRGVIENVAGHLRRVGRLRTPALSPHWKVVDQPTPPEDPGIPRLLKIGGAFLAAGTVLIFFLLALLLSSDLSAARNQLLR